jgi:hypothetical protein
LFFAINTTQDKRFATSQQLKQSITKLYSIFFILQVLFFLDSSLKQASTQCFSTRFASAINKNNYRDFNVSCKLFFTIFLTMRFFYIKTLDPTPETGLN